MLSSAALFGQVFHAKAPETVSEAHQPVHPQEEDDAYDEQHDIPDSVCPFHQPEMLRHIVSVVVAELANERDDRWN
jgi:hypothetical protein